MEVDREHCASQYSESRLFPGPGRSAMVGSKAIVGKLKKEAKFEYRGDGR